MNRSTSSVLVKPVIAVAAVLLTMTTFSAHAELAQGETPQAIVRYGDLDLSTESGAQRLYERISAAAETVCPAADARELKRAQLARACQAETIERAVSAVGNTRLASLQANRVRRGRTG